MKKLLIALSFIAPALIVAAEATPISTWLKDRETGQQRLSCSVPISYFTSLALVAGRLKELSLHKRVPHSHSLTALASTVDGQLLAALSRGETKKVTLYDFALQKAIDFSVPADLNAYVVAFSVSRTLAIGGERGWSGKTKDNSIRLFDTRGKLVGTVNIDNACSSLVCSPVEARLATRFNHETYDSVDIYREPVISYKAVEWDLATQQKIHDYGKHDNSANIAYSPDGQFLLIGKSRLETALFDVRTGQRAIDLPMIKDYRGELTSVACASNNRLVATGSNFGRIFLWDTRTRKLIETDNTYKKVDKYFSDHAPFYSPKRRISSIAFSPDSSAIATGDEDGLIKIYSSSALEECYILPTGAIDTINDVLYLPNGNLASSTYDSAVTLWIPN